MERLTKAEEPIMLILWKMKDAFVKEIIEKLPEPKPPYNTVSSVIRVLEEKGMVGYKAYGKTHQYFPKVSRAAYSAAVMKSMISDYFDGSVSQALSLMIKENEIPEEELKELKKLIKDHDHE